MWSFTDCISELNNKRSLWQYCKDIPAVNNGAIFDFNEAYVTDSFSIKEKLTSQTWDDGTKVVKIMIPLN